MRAHRNGNGKQESRLRNRTVGVCFYAGLVAFVLCVGPGMRVSFGQPASTPSGALEAAPKQTKLPEETRPQENKANGSAAQPAATVQAAKPELKAAIAELKQRQIAEDGAHLMKLATNLKLEVDKTTQDTLSVTVVRDAEEIEKLAHKMRTQ